ncbi:MAG: hypothetical protein WCH34_00285 [Bacteroidota bacterium]
MKKTTIFLLLSFLSFHLYSQTVYQHISDQSLYEFLDELANEHLINLNTTIKPYSRKLIAEKLVEANGKNELLTKRQTQEIEYYLNEFSLETGNLPKSTLNLYHKGDSLKIGVLIPEVAWNTKLSKILVRPIYGVRFFSKAKDNFYATYGGLEASAYLGKNFGIYASLRDNYQDKYLLAKPTYFTQEMGGNYKVNEGGRLGGDFSEMRGGLTYTWKWGDIGLIKDHLEWGDNYNGANIFSGRTPSFAMIKLHLKPAKWFDFNYFHGWLVSEVTDSAQSYITSNGDYRAVFTQKYIAANMYTISPWERFNLSIGNSIVYGDMPVQAAYLIPFMFFKSMDHTINHNIDNQNSQLFLNVNSRNIKHLHLFLSYYIDEFSLHRVTSSTRYNFVSTKVGFRLSDFPLRNIALTSEFTQTMPITYKHRVPSITFETNQFNLGHYLRDNSQELYVALEAKPYRTLKIKLSYLTAFHGNEIKYLTVTPVPIDAYPVLKNKTWSNETLQLRVEYRPFANTSVFLEYANSNIQGYDMDMKTAKYYLDMYTSEYLQGKNNILTLGFAFGFQ